jgi:ABC-type polysaccharide/polyol phosphate export permease
MNIIKEILSNKATIYSLAKNDFKNRYAGSYLGITWAFIQPLMTILIFWFVFEIGFRTPPIDNSIPYVIWFICGIIPWFYFSESILSGSASICDYSYIVKKVVFNINILPFIKLVVSTFVHLFFLILLFFICFLVKLPFTIHCIQIIYYSFCAFMLALGCSYLTSSIIPFSKDTGQFVNILMQFGFWLTPIVWNYEVLSPQLQELFKINPAFYIVQGFRDALVYKNWFWERPLSTLYFWIVTVFIFYVGKIIFRRLKPHFADVL